MRNWKRLISVVLALVLVSTMFTGLALAADPKEEVKVYIKSIKVSDVLKKMDPIEVDTDSYFSYSQIDYPYDEPTTYDWSKYDYIFDDLVFTSSDNSVLRVDKDGDYKARKAGEVTVTVASQFNPAINDTFTVKVKAKPVVTKISFSSSTFELKVSEELDLADFATIEPANATIYKASCVSDDPEIATASASFNGMYWKFKVNGVKAGTTKITVTITNEDNSEVTATANVTVTENALTNLSFSQSSITINKAEKQSINLKNYLNVSPKTAQNYSLKWESSDELVAYVDQNGKVYASTNYGSGRPGTATITVTSVQNPEIQASIEVTVVESEAITEVKFDENTIVLYFVEKVGKLQDQYNSQTVYLNIQPAAAADTIKTVTWRTSNAKVAIPKYQGKTSADIYAVGKGRCTITATFKDTSGKQYSASFKVKVTDKSPTAKLNKKAVTLKVKKSFKLSAKDADKGTTLKGTWKSSDKKVAKVNSKGKVTGVKPGRAIITFTPKNKTMNKVTCVVTVK